MSSIQNETIAMIVKDDDFISDDEIVNTLVENKINVNITDVIESKTYYHNDKCNSSVTSQFGYINGNQIEINEYIARINEFLDETILCSKNHELFKVECKKTNQYGIKKRSHFRHKHYKDLIGPALSEWHAEWQSNFPDRYNEVWFKKISELQIKDRRADIYLNELNTIVEIQNSKIEEDEVNNRKHDYGLHGLKIIWIINGNNETIDVKKLEYSKRVYLEFKTDYWKFQSFRSYEYIYIDIDEEIYKLNKEEDIKRNSDLKICETNDDNLLTTDFKTININLEDSANNESLDYKKLSLPKLRSIVTDKGLSADSSKLKKQDLLKLLGVE
jgi:hypothetical protein